MLGAAITNCKDIREVRLPGSSEESKIGQYADDGDLTLVDDFSIAKAFEIIRIYERGSGSGLNLGKTEGMWFGSMAGREDGPVNIKWRTDCIKILGIFFTVSRRDFECLNWNFQVEKLAKRLESWKFRSLSLKGKSMIINTLALSGLWYTGAVVPLPASAEKKINQIIFDFLWSGKNEQLKREVCYSVLHGWIFQIMCVYAPNDPRGRSEFFSDLWRHALPRIPLFLGGDFNCIESLELDKAGGDAFAGDKGSVELKDFADSVSICDVLRAKFPTRKLFTRHNKSNTNMSWIDRIYAPKDMISDAFGYTFDPCSYSDHDLVSVKFQCKQTAARGPGLWKFNSSLTRDDDYTGLLSQFLQDWKLQKGRYPDLRTWWDARKCHIRDITVELSTLKRREKRSQRSNLV